ncbi:MAG: hypothetical protein APR53_05965 [Methanoculleus sp. SDB]|nr:MAG: hypothetical protein APR53_05965 [Methanoculleus sp. SDB]
MHCYVSDEYAIRLEPGYAAWRLRDTIGQVAAVYGVAPAPEDGAIPVVAGLLLAPGSTEEDLCSAVAGACGTHRWLSVVLEGWVRDRSPGGTTLGIGVSFAGESERFLRDLRAALDTVASGAPAGPVAVPVARVPDTGLMREIWAGLGERPGLFERLLSALLPRRIARPRHIRPVLLPVDICRVALLRDGAVIRTFDLPTASWLSPAEADDRLRWQATLQTYRRERGLELTAPAHASGHQVFVISDLHLGHANIIHYCARPFCFSDTDEMDAVLANNWTATVKPADRVFFVGDLSYNRRGAPVRDQKKLLSGRVTFIRGNHDAGIGDAVDSLRLTYGGVDFLLVHDPKKAPDTFAGWTVHGHTHNNRLKTHPFFDPHTRRINVSAEVVGYRPVSLALLAEMIRRAETTGNRTPVIVRDACPPV